MTLWQRLVDRLIQRAQRTPYFHLAGYMERYWLLPPARYGWQRWLPLSIRVHHILSPDRDRHLHDHPWRFLSLVLRGWYFEQLPVSQRQHPLHDATASRLKTRRAGSLATRAATARHRITRVSPGGVWTLFIMFGKERRWGFHTACGWVYWRDYLQDYTTTTATDSAPGPCPANDGDLATAAARDLVRICHEAAASWWKPGDTANPLHFSNKLCLIHSEISEAMEGDRKQLMDDHLPHRPMREVELADAVIRIFDLAGGYGLDLPGALAEKLAYNARRADHRPEVRAAAGGKVY